MVDALFPLSSRVVVVGTSNNEINGKVGIVKKFDAPRKRYVVELQESKRQFALKAKNLAQADDDDDDDDSDLDDLPDLVSGDGDYDDMPALVPPEETVESSASNNTNGVFGVEDRNDPDFDDMPSLVPTEQLAGPAASNNNVDMENDPDLDDLPSLEPIDDSPPQQPAAPSTKSPPSTATKRCNICAKFVQSIHVVLPACSHVFCPTCPIHSPELQCCIVCQKCDPTVASIQELPYVSDLHDPPPAVLQLMLDEYVCLRNIEVMEAIESKHQKEVNKVEKSAALPVKKAKDTLRKVREMVTASNRPTRDSQAFKEAKAKVEEAEKDAEQQREKLQEKHIASWENRGIRSSISALVHDKEELAEQVTKAIDKHYRRASIKVHPDRYGDEFEEEFDALVKARNVLREADFRNKYMEQMLEVLCKVGASYVASSHIAWIKKHEPDVDASQKKQEAGKKKPVFVLQGGILYDKPRKLGVEILGLAERRVRLHVRLPRDKFQFFQYCKALYIFGEQANRYQSKEVCLATLGEVALSKLASKHEHGDFHVDVVIPQTGFWDVTWCFTMMTDGEATSTPRSEEVRVDMLSSKHRQHMKTLQDFEELARKRTMEIRSVMGKLSGRAQGATSQTYSTLQAVVLKGRHTMYLLKKWSDFFGDNGPHSSSSKRLADLQQVLLDSERHREKLDEILALHQKKKALKHFKGKVHEILESDHASSWVATISKNDLAEMNGDTNRLYQLFIEGKQAHSIELVDTAILDAAVARTDLFTPKQTDTLKQRCDEVEAKATEAAALAAKETEEKAAAERERIEMEKRGSLMERGSVVVLQGLKSQQQLNGSLATFMGLGQGDRYVVRLYMDSREVSLKKDNFRKWDGGLGGLNYGSSQEQQGWQCIACTYMHEGKLSATDKCIMCQTLRDSEGSQACAKANEETAYATDPVLEQEVGRRPKPIFEQEPQKPIADEKKVKSPKSPKRPGQRKQCMHGLRCKFLKKGICHFFHPPEKLEVAPAAKAKSAPFKKPGKLSSVDGPMKSNPVAPTAQPASQDASPADELRMFLKTQKPCLKCAPDKFLKWLEGEDILSLADLLDALGDEEYKIQLIYNGLKKFKAPVFQKSVERAIAKIKMDRTTKTQEPHEIPDELLCPITHSIFVDPVVAKDGCTYERNSIEEWFHKQQSQVNAAHLELLRTPYSDRAKAVIKRGVMAPSGIGLDDLSLVSNNNTRITARQFLTAASRD